MKILILCTGNSCRSQMAHGFVQSFLPSAMVRSAGTCPAKCVNPIAVKVMREVGIDISHHQPQNVLRYVDEAWDLVVTVCGDADKKCPTFSGRVRRRLHIGFDDPSEVVGAEECVMPEFKRVRDEIGHAFRQLLEAEMRARI